MQDRNKGVLLVFEVLALVSFFFCITSVDLASKNMLFLMPISFFIISLLFHENYHSINNISVLMIESLLLIRLVVLPFIYAFIPEIQLFEGKANVESYINKSSVLMSYECFCVNLSIFIYYNIKRKNDKKIKKPIISNIGIKLINYLAIFVLLLTVLFPNFRDDFKSILSLSDPDFTVASERVVYNIGTVTRILKTLYSLSFQIIRVLFPASVINALYHKNNNSKVISYITFLSCVLQFFFLTSTFAEAIVSCMAILLYYLSLYPERRKKTYKILGVSTIGMVVLYFTVRYFSNPNNNMYRNGDGPLPYIARIINAYFTGVDNVAAIFNIPPGNEIESVKAGLIGSIPFNSSIFGSRGNKLQYYYNNANRSYGQIPPTLGTGYYYFGSLLAPIITVAFVLLSVYFDERSQKEKGSLKYITHLFSCIVFALGTVMYSPSITLSWFMGWALPMMFLTSTISTDVVDNRKE